MLYDMDKEKEALTAKLSDQYSRNIINIDEYERLIEYIHKIETSKELSAVARIVQENTAENTDAPIQVQDRGAEKHLALFSWRSSNVVSLKGSGGTYISLFGANRIVIDNLPKGRTIIRVKAIFGLTEILVAPHIKIINKTTPVFSGIFAPNEVNREGDDLPELYITGTAVFGNITIRRA